MVFKDQDDCSKRLLCELNARLVDGEELTENEKIIADSFGKNNNIEIGEETLAFDLAAVLGKTVSISIEQIEILIYNHIPNDKFLNYNLVERIT